MDDANAKRLGIGSRVVIYPNSPNACTGTVKEADENWVGIKWDDGGGTTSIHRLDMQNVEEWFGAGTIIPQRRAAA